MDTALGREARYVDVTMLDVTGCDDRLILVARIAERIDGGVGGYATVALAWPDIRHNSTARGYGAALLDASWLGR